MDRWRNGIGAQRPKRLRVQAEARDAQWNWFPFEQFIRENYSGLRKTNEDGKLRMGSHFLGMTVNPPISNAAVSIQR